MAAEVVVMYDDLAIVRVPFADRATLRRDGVLSIAISHPEQPPTEGRSRLRQQLVLEHDFYVLAYDQARDKCFLGGYEAVDFGWFSLAEPWAETEPWALDERSQPPWFPAGAIVFRGSQVSGDVWAQARVKIGDPDGEMY